jgi:enoyl-CoA hydratase/carnithine racemase
MVNHVVPRNDLSRFVLELAGRITNKPSFALKLTKEAVNRAMDATGQQTAIDQAFALHQLATPTTCRNSAWRLIRPGCIRRCGANRRRARY